MKTPELWELISLFECEPKYIYGEDKRIPWFYNTLEFVLIRGCDKACFIISPAEKIIDFRWYSCERQLMHLNLECVEEIKVEKTNGKEILHIIFNKDTEVEKLFIELKPVIYLYGSISTNKP